MNVTEIIDWVDRWFEPTFGEAEAQGLFGAAADGNAIIAPAVPRDPRFRDVVFERVQRPPGFLSGVQLTLANPESISWDDVVGRFGAPQLVSVPWDNWGGPKMYGFKLSEKGQAGQLVLGVKGKPTANATIASVILRRFPSG
jgi:hypothetical protein